MKAISTLILSLALSHQALAQPNSLENTSADKKPINILINNWSSQIILSKITGKIFNHLGYPVSYINSTVDGQWGALAYGSADIQVEVWEGTMTSQYTHTLDSGTIVDAGNHKALTREDWWYPNYVEELCPGLPDWKALKNCSELFSRPNSNGSGVYFAGPWEKPDEAKVRALNLDFIVNIFKNSDAIWVELEDAYQKKLPIMIHNWSPNWVESRYKGKFVEFPKFHPDCETDPSWGINKNFLYDCGNPKNGWLKKVANTKFAENNACAFNTLKNINFSNQQISETTAWVYADALSYDQAADTWLTQNSNLWKTWIAKECL